MKKNVLIKGILVLLVIALLTIGFSGCGIIIPCTTGTVYLNIDDNWQYWVYIDGGYWGLTDWNGDAIIANLAIGYHTFYVESTDSWCDAYAYPTLVCGPNNVWIDPFCW